MFLLSVYTLNLGKDDRYCQEDGEEPDHHHHLPAVAQGADTPGVDRVDYHYKPLKCHSRQVQDRCCGGENSEKEIFHQFR